MRRKPSEGAEIIRQVQGQKPEPVSLDTMTPITISVPVGMTSEEIQRAHEHYAKSDVVISVEKKTELPPPILIEKSGNGPFKPRASLSLEERLEEAKARLAASSCVAESCYWQGALDMIESYSTGMPMPEVIGAGVKVA